MPSLDGRQIARIEQAYVYSPTTHVAFADKPEELVDFSKDKEKRDQVADLVKKDRMIRQERKLESEVQESPQAAAGDGNTSNGNAANGETPETLFKIFMYVDGAGRDGPYATPAWTNVYVPKEYVTDKKPRPDGACWELEKTVE